MDAIALVRVAYLGAAAATYAVAVIPALRDRFLSYGPRASGAAAKESRSRSFLSAPAYLLDRLAGLRVPHSWFTSFYAILVTLVLFWSSQIISHGAAFQALVDFTSPRAYSMSVPQTVVSLGLVLAQGTRRLLECLAFVRQSDSKMWIGHWILGAGFYVGLSVAVFIEGLPVLKIHQFTLQDLSLLAPSFRTFITVLLFILASGWQHDCHAYLAALRDAKTEPTSKSGRYKLPKHPAFARLIAPHYTAECIIYLALAILATPSGRFINMTLLSAWVFVMVNLGITAGTTKTWYAEKFGMDAVKDKWCMIPFIY